MPYISVDNLFFTYALPSSSNTGRDYVIAWGANLYDKGVVMHNGLRDWSCTCADWQRRRKYKGGYCKHILYIQGLAPHMGGAAFWQETPGSKPCFYPRLMDMIRMVVAVESGAEDAILTHIGRNWQAKRLAFTPYSDIDGDPIPAVYLNDDKAAPKVVEQGDYRLKVLHVPSPLYRNLMNEAEYAAETVEESAQDAQIVPHSSHDWMPPLPTPSLPVEIAGIEKPSLTMLRGRTPLSPAEQAKYWLDDGHTKGKSRRM